MSQNAPQGNPLDVRKNTFDEYEAYDGADPRFFIRGRIGRNGLTFRIRTRDLSTNEKSTIPPKVFFNAMMTELGKGDDFRAIIGDWDSSDPAYTSNLWAFNQGINAGKTPEQAAATTFTGQWASDWGYDEVQFARLDPQAAIKDFTRVLVRFVNSNK